MGLAGGGQRQEGNLERGGEALGPRCKNQAGSGGRKAAQKDKAGLGQGPQGVGTGWEASVGAVAADPLGPRAAAQTARLNPRGVPTLHPPTLPTTTLPAKGLTPSSHPGAAVPCHSARSCVSPRAQSG